jgi:hypothetical protein
MIRKRCEGRRHHLRGSKSNQIGARAQRRSRTGSPAYLVGEHSKFVRHIGSVTVWKIVPRVSTPFGSSDSRIINTGHLQASAPHPSLRKPGEDVRCNTQVWQRLPPCCDHQQAPGSCWNSLASRKPVQRNLQRKVPQGGLNTPFQEWKASLSIAKVSPGIPSNLKGAPGSQRHKVASRRTCVGPDGGLL